MIGTTSFTVFLSETQPLLWSKWEASSRMRRKMKKCRTASVAWDNICTCMCACAPKGAFGWHSLVKFDGLISLQEESKESVSEDVKEDFPQSTLLCYAKHIVNMPCHALSTHLGIWCDNSVWKAMGREPLRYRVILEFPFALQKLFIGSGGRRSPLFVKSYCLTPPVLLSPPGTCTHFSPILSLLHAHHKAAPCLAFRPQALILNIPCARQKKSQGQAGHKESFHPIDPIIPGRMQRRTIPRITGDGRLQ